MRVKGGLLTFFICLECGNPYGYSSFDNMLCTFQQLNSKPKPKRLKTPKPFNKISRVGKAGFLSKTYKLYLQTDHWKELRTRKLKSKPVCEICKVNKATEVHHLIYSDSNGESILYKENLNQLASICRMCHKKQHHIT